MASIIILLSAAIGASGSPAPATVGEPVAIEISHTGDVTQLGSPAARSPKPSSLIRRVGGHGADQSSLQQLQPDNDSLQPDDGDSRAATEMIEVSLPLRGDDGQPLKSSLLESTALLASASHTSRTLTCLEGDVSNKPAFLDADGAEHLYAFTATTVGGDIVEMMDLETHPDPGNGMMCCDGNFATTLHEELEVNCHRMPDRTSLTEIPNRFIRTNLSDLSSAGIDVAADQIVRLVRTAPANTIFLVQAPVLDPVLSALEDHDRHKVVDARNLSEGPRRAFLAKLNNTGSSEKKGLLEKKGSSKRRKSVAVVDVEKVSRARSPGAEFIPATHAR